MLLKLVNENFGNTQFRTFGDASNHQHVFEWNKAVGAYCYQPKSQKESDDIIRTNWECMNFPWRVAPVWDGVMEAGAPVPPTNDAAIRGAKIPPYVNPEIYSQYPLRDLIDLAADAGFVPEGDPTNLHTIRHQLHRYYEGRAWAVEDIKRLREENAALKARLAAQVAPAPLPAEKPAAAKRGPKVKARELQTV